MKVVNGLAFPDADRFMVAETSAQGTYQLSHLEAALRHVTRFDGTAVDGGAHVGTWSTVLSRRFRHVVAFEPSVDTFECLDYNLLQAGCANVDRYQAALGSAPGRVALMLDPVNEARANTGARHIVREHVGTVTVLTLDSLELSDVAFIKLDVEGSELVALMGAAETLDRCRPVVLFEDKGLGKRYYGERRDAIPQWLTSRGYVRVDRISCDEIWRPRP